MKSKSFRCAGHVLKMGKTCNTNIIFLYSEEVHSDSPKRKKGDKMVRIRE